MAYRILIDGFDSDIIRAGSKEVNNKDVFETHSEAKKALIAYAEKQIDKWHDAIDRIDQLRKKDA